MQTDIGNTLLYAGILGLMYLFLTWRVVRMRIRHGIGIGDGGRDDLARAIRVHANFGEYVPLILVIVALTEMAGAGAVLVHILGGGLVLARLLHAWGLTASSGTSPGRASGAALTLALLAAASLTAIYLFINPA